MRTSELIELLRQEFGFEGQEGALVARARRWARHYGVPETETSTPGRADWDDAGIQAAVARCRETQQALAAGRFGYLETAAEASGLNPASMRCYLIRSGIRPAGRIWPADLGHDAHPRYVYDLEALRAARARRRSYVRQVGELAIGKLRDLAPGRHGGEAAYKRQKCRCRWCVAGQSGRSARSRHDGEPQTAIAIEALVHTLRDPTLAAGEIEQLAEVLKAVASPVRATIIGVLGNTDGPVDYVETFGDLGWDANNIRVHLGKLAAAGVVERIGDRMVRLADRYR